MLKLYNTATRRKENFKPLHKSYVGIYTCGPTVYNYAHIGNFRAYLTADILQRYLKYKGYRVRWVMNITDIDDKTIAGAKSKRMSLERYTSRYKKAFIEDTHTLNIQKCNFYPEATEHIPEMVRLVKTLLRRGYAYWGDNSIYFNISKFKRYGQFGRIDLRKIRPGIRVDYDSYNKTDIRDFVLWKGRKKGEPFWSTEIGEGRPGWHLECSAMAVKYLGQPFDIHTGGVDLIFPHHENEIAQSMAAYGQPLAKFWIHNEHLLVNSKKMSKSLGNFYTLRDITAKGYHPIALRYFYLCGHYRDKLNFTFTSLKSAQSSFYNLVNFVKKLYEIKGSNTLSIKIRRVINKAKEAFEKHMDNDLNTPKALAVLFSLVGEVNRFGIDRLTESDASLIIKTILDFDKVLGLEIKQELVREEGIITKEIMGLVWRREKLRAMREFKKADEIRKELAAKGIYIEDTKKGPRVTLKG